MQIKITMRYHLTSIRMGTIKKTKDSKCDEDAEKREPLYTAVGNANYYLHYEKQYGDSSKIKNRTTI